MLMYHDERINLRRKMMDHTKLVHPSAFCWNPSCAAYGQVIKHRCGYHLTGVTIKVIYGTQEQVCSQVGAHTAYVERTNQTSRQMNGRLVRKTLSYSKQFDMLEASCAWED